MAPCFDEPAAGELTVERPQARRQRTVASRWRAAPARLDPRRRRSEFALDARARRRTPPPAPATLADALGRAPSVERYRRRTRRRRSSSSKEFGRRELHVDDAVACPSVGSRRPILRRRLDLATMMSRSAVRSHLPPDPASTHALILVCCSPRLVALAACTLEGTVARRQPAARRAARSSSRRSATRAIVFPPFVSDAERPTGSGSWSSTGSPRSTPTLTTIGDKDFTPQLAQKWTWAPDSLSIAFSIDPRARWHDGKPVTASDVRYSFKAFTDPKVGSPVAPLLDEHRLGLGARLADGGRVVQEAHARAVLRRRVSARHHSRARLRQHSAPSSSTRPTSTRTPDRHRDDSASRNGSRARASSSSPTRRTIAAARSSIASFSFRPIRATGAAQMLSGQADFMEAFPIDQVPKLDSNTFARPVAIPQLGYAFLAMNRFAPKSKTAPHPIFCDHARSPRALDGGRSRSRCCRTSLATQGRLVARPFRDDRRATPTARLHPPPFDTTAAKAMLDSSGWRVGRERHAREERPAASILADRVRLEPVSRGATRCCSRSSFERSARRSTSSSSTASAVLRAQDAGDFDAMLGGFSTGPESERRRSRPGRRRASGRTDRTSCATRIRRSTRCSTARPRRSIRRRCKALRVARVPAHHRRRAGDLAVRHRRRRRRESAHQRAPACAPTNGGRNLADWTIPAGQAHRSRSHRTRAAEALSGAATPRRAARPVADRRPHRDDDQLLRHPLGAGRSVLVRRREHHAGDSRALARAVRLRPTAPRAVRALRQRASRTGSSATRSASASRSSRALAEALPRTLLLVGVALALSFVLGVIVGVLQATRRGQLVRSRQLRACSLTFYSLPDFWAALMISLLFAYWWPCFRAGDMVDPAMHDYMGAVGRVRRSGATSHSAGRDADAAHDGRRSRAISASAMLEVLARRLHPHGAREGTVRARRSSGDTRSATALTPMVTLLGLAASRRCSAARCSSRKCSPGRAWACSPPTRSAAATTISSRRR